MHNLICDLVFERLNLLNIIVDYSDRSGCIAINQNNLPLVSLKVNLNGLVQ